MISKSGVHLPDTTYDGIPIAWKDAYDSDEELRRLRTENTKLRELVYDMLEDEERGHNDDSTYYEHVERANELGLEFRG